MTDEATLPFLPQAFSRGEKERAIERELKLRKDVYRRRVETGKMTPQEAKYQIAVFESILTDYRR